MEKNVGIYIHIPFCAGKCAYCDFYSVTATPELMQRYKDAVVHHIREWSSQLDGFIIDTVYFGGGTPSYFGAGRLISILGALKKYGKVLKDAEITLEANPESITLMELLRLRRAGFNRLSLGVQSADDRLLKSLGRLHDFAGAEKAVEEARRAGFNNLSLDLIYGLPSQTRTAWADTLMKATSLKPEHMSCYGLKLEPGTPIYSFRDSPFIPDDDTQADMYLYTVDTLDRLGYRQYEISNFARMGFQSEHNLKYWRCKEYIGFGAAAHSYVGGRRYSYLADVEKYCSRVKDGGIMVERTEKVSDFERAGEYLMLGLRTTLGISGREYQETYHGGFDRIAEKMDYYVKHGFALKNGDRWCLTPRGFLVSNTIIAEVLEAQTWQRTEAAPYIVSETEPENQITMFPQLKREAEWFRGI